MNHQKSEKGQALILIVLAILGMIALTAAAVDGGMAYSERRQAQNTADAAALDAGLAKIRGGNLLSEGLARAASNGFNNDGTTNTVTVNNPPAAGCDGAGPYVGNTQYVQVIIRARTQTYFAPVIGITEVRNCVEAIAHAVPSITQPMFPGNAIVSLAEHECQAVKYQGNANTTIIGGGIYVNSDCASSAFFNNSSSAKLTAPCLQAVGGITYKPGAINIPSSCIDTGAAPLPPVIYPNPVCTGNAQKTGNTLSPGNVSGTFPPSGVTQLQAGIYCLSGNFRLNAGDSLSGDNVLIVVNSGDVRWNGGATVNLSAPTSGPFAGLLLFMPESNDNEIVINGNSSSTFTGSILAPSSPITINGTGGASGLQCQVIGYTVELSGNSATKITYNAGQNYHAPTNPSLELAR